MSTIDNTIDQYFEYPQETSLAITHVKYRIHFP